MNGIHVQETLLFSEQQERQLVSNIKKSIDVVKRVEVSLNDRWLHEQDVLIYLVKKKHSSSMKNNMTIKKSGI